MKSYPHDFWSERRHNELHVWGAFVALAIVTTWIGATLFVLMVDR